MARKPSQFCLVMNISAIVSAVFTAILSFLCHHFPSPSLVAAAITLGTICYHFSMRLLVGTIVPPLAKHINPESPWFRQRLWEAALYEKLGIRRWKGSIPTYDPKQFDLKRNTLAQVIHNMCAAELVHEVIILLSWVPLLFSIPFGEFAVFAATSAAAALYDSIFVIAQRYNRPRLMRILKKKEHFPL